ncbi:hypothetical protein MAPG_03868 [Magnaporthiopsis poae ATCC 64411]|uniref:50S ribosomal protein L34 n=1 Tax=Magnaporthiopsis poae (strain ATCC 64411 / 73-15) TaxID=644358 RepID=A0A0C4DV67_MAGP6|nr:hypothetical protein MAPG_03868 [Magnaporthiopsis poae ATCC 64411]
MRHMAEDAVDAKKKWPQQHEAKIENCQQQKRPQPNPIDSRAPIRAHSHPGEQFRANGVTTFLAASLSFLRSRSDTMASIAILAPRLRMAAAPTQRIPRVIVQRLGGSQRHFSSLPSLRPTTCPRTSPLFRSSHSPLPFAIEESSRAAATSVLDLVPKTAITSHPALGGVASQIRCGPRPTTARTSRLKRARTHGFLSRIRTKNGRKLLARRRAKGRLRLSG